MTPNLPSNFYPFSVPLIPKLTFDDVTGGAKGVVLQASPTVRQTIMINNFTN
jgi:hypothetical protein